MPNKTRYQPELKEGIGKHDFSVVPRSLFAPDGSMLHCPMKNSLMNILEKLPTVTYTQTQTTQEESISEIEPSKVQTAGAHMSVHQMRVSIMTVTKFVWFLIGMIFHNL